MTHTLVFTAHIVANDRSRRSGNNSMPPPSCCSRCSMPLFRDFFRLASPGIGLLAPASGVGLTGVLG